MIFIDFTRIRNFRSLEFEEGIGNNTHNELSILSIKLSLSILLLLNLRIIVKLLNESKQIYLQDLSTNNSSPIVPK
jgi:hypothetical protein